MKTIINSSVNKTPNHNIWKTETDKSALWLILEELMRPRKDAEGFPGITVVKNLPAVQEKRDTGSIPDLGRSPREGNGNPFQYSCLENPKDRGARWATVQGVTKSWTRLSTHTHRTDLNISDIYCLLHKVWGAFKEKTIKGFTSKHPSNLAGCFGLKSCEFLGWSEVLYT